MESVDRHFTKSPVGSGKPILSFGGTIILLNAVLSSLPIYYLSFYRAPKKVIYKIVQLQRRFLRGGGGVRSVTKYVGGVGI